MAKEYRTKCKICDKEYIVIETTNGKFMQPPCPCRYLWNGNPQDIIKIELREIE